MRSLLPCGVLPFLPQDGSVLLISVTENRKPVPFRIHLRDARGKTVLCEGHPSWRDHCVIDGSATLALPEGEYSAEIERGPEYPMISRTLRVEAAAQKGVVTKLRCIANLAAEGGWSGDLHVHRLRSPN